MKKLSGFFLIMLTLFSCHKNNSNTTPSTCNIQQVYIDNAKKVTITNGIWGTVSSMKGNCMPGASGCTDCPAKRTVMIYQYTMPGNATTSGIPFYDSFNTLLVAQTDTDEDGFFQIIIPSGHYTFAIIEKGKLFVEWLDEQGGLGPFVYSTGAYNLNVTLTDEAAF